MNVVIVAGEASGDLYGAELARALRARHPDTRVFGMGGPRMRRAGVDLWFDTSTWGAIGIANALKVVPVALRAYRGLRRRLQQERPDVVVPIDFGAFNVRVGNHARSLGVPVYYFITPGSWRRQGPISPVLLSSADRFCTQLPWHAERLRSAGVAVDYFGHPLLDLAHPSAPVPELRDRWGLASQDPVLCLLPGSRRHEVEYILPLFLDAGALIRREVPGARFVLGLAEVADRAQVARILQSRGWVARDVPDDAPRGHAWAAGTGEKELLVATGRTYDCLAVSRAALCASGTVTLEAAILGIPHVIAYRGSPGMRLQYQFVKHRIKYVGLPNLLLDEMACPELLDVAATPEAVAAAGLPLLKGGPEAKAQAEALRRLGDLLGEPGTIQRAAEGILALGGR